MILKKTCEHCDKSYYPNRSDQKYCCRKCSNKARSIRNSKEKPKPKPIIKKCLNCGKEFVVNHPRKSYCSDKCHGEYLKIYREIKRQRQLTREFSDMTYTLVASALLNGEPMSILIEAANWDEKRFYQQMIIHQEAIKQRMKYIEFKRKREITNLSPNNIIYRGSIGENISLTN